MADDCDEKTKKLIDSVSCKKFFSSRSLLISKSRNLGFKKSSGNIIAFTDGDCIPSKNWIKEIDKIPKNVDIVYGRRLSQKMPFNDFREIKYKKRSGKHSERGKRLFNKNNFKQMYLISGQNMAIRKEFLSETFFDIDFDGKGCEDLDLQWRAIEKNRMLLFNPNMIVLHCHKHNLLQHFRKAIKYGSGEKYLEKRNPKITENIWYNNYTPRLRKAFSSPNPKAFLTELIDYVGRKIGGYKNV